MLPYWYMNRAIAGLFISLGFLVPVLASAHSSSHKGPKDTTPPSLTSIHIESNNASTTLAKAGDTVTITFTASEKIQTPVVLVETKKLFVKALNTSGNTWSASYTVTSKDPLGRVDYLFMIADTSNNVFGCSSVRLPLVKYCPTTDGSSVTIYKETAPPPPPPADTTPPTIEAHADVFATTTEISAEVTYITPAANDAVSGSVAVSCIPPSGSTFALGTTTIVCGAQDAAGNAATSTFSVVVEQEIVAPPYVPSPYTMGSQPDESFLCGDITNSWRFCDEQITTSFTGGLDSGIATIDLGPGSSMGTGTIQTVTIAGEMDVFHPWGVTISCYTDAVHTSACGDWPAISDPANETDDGKYWDADFSALNRTFNQDDYYVMTINDTGQEAAVYGSESLEEPYWLIIGLR